MPWWRLRASWVYAAIVEGELSDHAAPDVDRYALLRESLGTLAFPGGELVAADPYVMDDEPPPFTQRMSAEAAEVVAVRATIGENHDRVAALVLRLGPSAVVEWVMATLPGQDVDSLDAERFFGYGVDAGTGAFGSPEAMAVAARVLSADAGMLEDPVSSALFADGVGSRNGVVVAPEEGATPIAVCSSGWGDGSYPTWLGVDAAGNVMLAVADFLLTVDPYVAPLPPPEEPPPGRPKPSWRRWFGG